MTSTSPTSIAMPRKGSSSISAQDLVKLLDSNAKTGFIRQKRTTKIMRSIKWSHKFVVLANSALYIFENETSRTPDTSINLLGYIAVEREVPSTCVWVFSLVPGAPSLARKSFACSNAEERKDWMQRIKERLYLANNVKDASLSRASKEKLKMAEHLSPEEQFYVELELPVISPEDSSGGKKIDNDADNDDDVDEDPDDIDDEEEDEVFSKSTKSLSNNPSIKRSPNYEDSKGLLSVDNADGGGMPPRYSAIIGGVEREYQNLSASSSKAKEFGLEQACTITDENLCRDREKCVEMLKATKKVGTYLIRQSRRDDYKVLAVLASETTVKEYRIEESYGLFHLLNDSEHEFPTMSSLLAYFSHHKPLPNYKGYLGWGIHECGDGSGENMYTEASG